MNALTAAVAGHDDETSAINAKHKAAKKLRLQTVYAPIYEPVPAARREPGNGILDGVFQNPIKGFSFRVRGGTATRATDSEEYTREVVALAKKRAKYLRIRNRDGKETRDTGEYKNGGVSLVITLAPWHVKTAARLGPLELEDLMLRLAEVAGREMQDVSGRPLYGGGAHFSSAVPHFHLHVLKSADGDPPGTPGLPYPKGKFLSSGPCTCGWERIESRFPGLLANDEREMLSSNLAKKDQDHLIDIKISEAIDREMEKFILEKGTLYVKQAEEDAAEYVIRKKKAMASELERPGVQWAIKKHKKTGVWPLAYQCMTLTMWRMVPPELRVAIQLSIRAYQIIRKPSPKRLLSLGKSMVSLCEPAPITQPTR